MKLDALDRYAPLFSPPDRSFDGFLRRRDRKRRNERIGALALAFVVALVAVGGAVLAFRRATREVPATPSLTTENVKDLAVAWSASLTGAPSGIYDGFDVGAQEPFPPTLDGDHVYVGTFGGTLYAFPTACGANAMCRPSWTANTDGGIPFPPTVVDGTVYVGSTGGVLSAFPADCANDGSTCAPTWVADIGHELGSSPVVADGYVFGIDPQGGMLYSFPVACSSPCRPAWTASIHSQPVPAGHATVLPGDVIRQVYAPAVADGVVYAPGFGQGQADRLFAMDEHSGRLLWVGRASLELGTSPFWNVPVVAGGYVVETFQRVLYAFPVTCTPVKGVCRPSWSVASDALEGDGVMGPPLVSGDSVYVKTWSSETLGHTFAFRVGLCATHCQPSWSMLDDGFGDLVVASGTVYSTSIHSGYVDTAPIDCERGGRSCAQAGRLDALEGPEPPTAGDGVVFWGTEKGTVYGVPSGCATPESCTNGWTWNGGTEPVSSPAVGASTLYVASRDGTVTAFAVGAAQRPGLSRSARNGTALFYGALVLAIGTSLVIRSRRRRRI